MNNNNNFDTIKINMFDKMNDDISMKTKVWGPPAWFFLHSMAMAYPKKINYNNPEHVRIKNAMFSILSNFGAILPCIICGVSYSNYIKTEELSIEKYLNSRADLSFFIWLLHEKVNTKLGVPLCDRLSFEDTIKYYYKFRARGKTPCNSTTENERINSLLAGCDNNDMKKNHLKDYKCIINIIDNNKDMKKEYFEDYSSLDNFKNSTKKSSSIILLILCIVFLIIIIFLLFVICKKKLYV